MPVAAPVGYMARLRRRAVDDDAAFAEWMTEGQLVFPRHLREMSAFADVNPSGIILEPRGHAKTTWYMYRAARRIGVTAGKRRLGIVTSVTTDAAARSTAIRRTVENPLYAKVFPWARGGPQGDAWTDVAWTVKGVELGKDYTCFAVGLQAARAGPRMDDMLADDMVGKLENSSSFQREKAKETYLSVVDPMIVPGGTRMFLGTRWHDDDLYAWGIAQGWPLLLRKAIQDDGTALWPDVWPIWRLMNKRNGGGEEAPLGAAIFDLQYQNDPRGMGGNIFKRDWLKYVDVVPEGRRRIGMDLAVGEKERSDYNAVVEAVEDGEGNLYIVGAWRERLEDGHTSWLTGTTPSGELITHGKPYETGPRLLWPMDKLPAGWAGVRMSYPVPRRFEAVNIESVQAQALVTREILRTTKLPARPVYPRADKVSESRGWAIRYETGKVFHLRNGQGIDLLEQEQISFPNAEHDDLVDAGRYAADVGGSEFSFTKASW